MIKKYFQLIIHDSIGQSFFCCFIYMFFVALCIYPSHIIVTSAQNNGTNKNYIGTLIILTLVMPTLLGLIIGVTFAIFAIIGITIVELFKFCISRNQTHPLIPISIIQQDTIQPFGS